MLEAIQKYMHSELPQASACGPKEKFIGFSQNPADSQTNNAKDTKWKGTG